MTGMLERLKISRQGDRIVDEEDGKTVELPEHTKVSMNFFCYHPSFIQLCEEEFQNFLRAHSTELKSEFLLPTATDHFIKQGKGKVEVIPTSSKWFGVTYKEDAPVVEAAIKKLVQQGEYPDNLWK